MTNYYSIPKEKYLRLPENQTCYEYMKESSARIMKDIGDYDAVRGYGANLTVTQLCSEVERLAAYLSAQGVGKGDVYINFLPTSIHAFTAFYALNKIGAVSYFVHPMTPPDALEEMIQLTRAKGVIMFELFVPAFTDVLVKHNSVICCASDYGVAPETLGDKLSALPLAARYSDIMNAPYTEVPTVTGIGKEPATYMNGGGTTGRSKIVILSSYAINNVAYDLYLIDTPHEYGERQSLAVLPCFHAYGLCDALHYPVCNAYTAICMPKFDAQQANEIIRKNKIALLLGVPNMFMKMYAQDNFENEGLQYLMHICAGGDAVNETFKEEFNACLKRNGCKGELIAGYGMTEMAAACTTNSYAYNRSGSIGYVYENTCLKICDENGNELPQGEIGEIVMRGRTMMLGYLPDGYVEGNGLVRDDNGESWVPSGDLGYVDKDGYLYFSGRKKRIIIISGYNVYPATIENTVSRLGYIDECCAVQGYDEDGKPYAKLCVTLKDATLDREETAAKIRTYCENNLERIACPKKIEILDSFPRTKMDKISFLALMDKLPLQAAQ